MRVSGLCLLFVISVSAAAVVAAVTVALTQAQSVGIQVQIACCPFCGYWDIVGTSSYYLPYGATSVLSQMGTEAVHMNHTYVSYRVFVRELPRRRGQF